MLCTPYRHFHGISPGLFCCVVYYIKYCMIAVDTAARLIGEGPSLDTMGIGARVRTWQVNVSWHVRTGTRKQVDTLFTPNKLLWFQGHIKGIRFGDPANT